MEKNITRRKFLADSSLSTAGLIIGSKFSGSLSMREPGISSYDIMKEVMKYRKFDAHAHLNFSADPAGEQLRFADRLGIERLSVSRPVTGDIGTNEDVVRCNDLIIKAVKSHPDRFIGFFTLIPTFVRESMDELKRCVDAGMSGYKGYLQVKVNHPSYYPVIEKLIDLKMICFMHAYLGLGRGGYRTGYGNIYPNETTPEDMIEVAKRYPEADFQWAHIGAGGDWEYQCKALSPYPNIYVDTSGSNNEAGMMDYALRYIGEDRLLYGSDGSYYQGISKILAEGYREDQLKKIFFDNYNKLLGKGGRNVA
jgi:predicted TIM-barrel fold metal-dependent hydrolase